MREDNENIWEILNDCFYIVDSDAVYRYSNFIGNRKYKLLKFHITVAKLEKKNYLEREAFDGYSLNTAHQTPLPFLHRWLKV